MQECLGNFEGIWYAHDIKSLVFLVFFFLLFLLGLESLEVVLLYLLEVVVSTEHHFFALKAKSHRVGTLNYLFYALKFTLEGFHEVV